MDAPDPQHERDRSSTETEAVVSCHETKPGRRVFTERGNADGWISSDLVVELSR